MKSRRAPNRLLTTAVVLAGSLGINTGMSQLDSCNLNEARAEAHQTVTECRDVVRCALGQISMAVESETPGLREVDYKLNGNPVHLGNHTFKVGISETHGYVLVDENGEYFLAGDDLENTISNVKLMMQERESVQVVLR